VEGLGAGVRGWLGCPGPAHTQPGVMEPRKLATKFAQLRLPHIQHNTDRLLRLRGQAPIGMDQLVNDFNTALEETAGSNTSQRSGSRRKAWKRRCKSTSNLLSLQGQNLSDDSSSSVDNVGLLSRERGTSSLQWSDSDMEMGGGHCHRPELSTTRCGRPRLSRLHEYRTKRSSAGPDLPGVESDSFNENISPFKEFRANSKRKRKFKRMAVDPSPENRKPRMTVRAGVTQGLGPHTNPATNKRKKVRSRSGHLDTQPQRLPGSRRNQLGGIVPGKRKRSAREKSVESGEVVSSGRSRTVSLGEEGALNQPTNMDTQEVGSTSSLSSSSEWEDLHSDASPEGEADDEQSDWPGPEPGLAVMQLTDEEIDPDISFSQLLAGPGPSRLGPGQGGGRPVKSGTRRLKGGLGGTGPSPPSHGLPGNMHHLIQAYTDQVSRFIQDTSRQSLRLPAVRATDRNMILNLASLYTLSWSPEGPSVLLLTKTGQTLKPEFAIPGIPARPLGQSSDRKAQDIKRQRRTPPLTAVPMMGASTSSGVCSTKTVRQASGSRSRHKGSSSASGSKSN